MGGQCASGVWPNSLPRNVRCVKISMQRRLRVFWLLCGRRKRRPAGDPDTPMLVAITPVERSVAGQGMAFCASGTSALHAKAPDGIPRPHCARAKDGGPDRDQTDDLFVANEALYQLSYRPVRNVTYCEIDA